MLLGPEYVPYLGKLEVGMRFKRMVWLKTGIHKDTVIMDLEELSDDKRDDQIVGFTYFDEERNIRDSSYALVSNMDFYL